MKILLSIEGGAGKNLAATGAIKKATEMGHVVDIITAWPSIFEGNPYINKIYDWGRYEYLQEQLKGYDKLILNDPYRQHEFLTLNIDLTAQFNWMLNECMEYVKPEFYYSLAELEEVKAMLSDIQKPILAIQTNGGTGTSWNWPRDFKLEEAVELINQLTSQYEIIHFRGPNQPEITGIKHIGELSLRQAIIALEFTQKRIFIDSVYQHAAAALNKESIVLWNATDSNKFGHPIHDNIQANAPLLKNMNRLDGLFNGLDNSNNKCPFAPHQKIFNINDIILKLS